MSGLSRGQESIIKYLSTQYDLDMCEIEAIGDDKVRLTEVNGASKIYTMNVFWDIMDAGTKEIIAISDVPHTLDSSRYQLPKQWRRAV